MWKRKLLFGFRLMVALFLATSILPGQVNDEETIKVDVALVNIPVVVSDKLGRSILDLNKDNFALFEDGKEQKIEYLSTQNTPLSIVLLLDTSKSAKEIIERIKTAAGKFVQQLKPTDRCMIISFSDKVQVESEFTSKQIRLDRAIKNIVMSDQPGTLLQDAIYVTVDRELAKTKGRKAIILITDGKDAGSAKTKKELMYRLEESDTPIYSIFYETTNFLFSSQPANKNNPPIKAVYPQTVPKPSAKTLAKQQQSNLQAAEFMQKMSDTTAGRIFPKNISNLNEAFLNVAEELRKQYLISYYPEDPNFDLTKHQIRIKVNRPNTVVRTKNYTRLR
jgi:VWFA-related protein